MYSTFLHKVCICLDNCYFRNTLEKKEGAWLVVNIFQMLYVGWGMGGWGWMESRWKVRKCPLEEIIYIWTDDRHILCVKKWRYAQSTCKLFFFSFLQYFYKCSALLQGFFLPILQCCLFFVAKIKIAWDMMNYYFNCALRNVNNEIITWWFWQYTYLHKFMCVAVHIYRQSFIYSFFVFMS